MLLHILLSPDVLHRHAALARELADRGLVYRALDTVNLHTILREEAVDVVVATPRELDGDPLASVRALRARPRPPEVVLLLEDIETGPWIAAGATALAESLAPSLQLQVLERVLERARASRFRRVRRRDSELERTLAVFGTTSSSIRRFQEDARQAASSTVPVLIRGEPGAGRSWLGPVLHIESPRARDSFHRFSFAAGAAGGREDAALELFGHVAGAAAGRTRAGRGLFEKAHGGSLFLEHLDQAPQALQRELGGYLERGSIRPVGGRRRVPVDVRILASVPMPPSGTGEASPPTLHPRLAHGFELADLVVPPLRERRDDIPELCRAALARSRQRFGLRAADFSDAAMDALCRHAWPGNLQELWSVVERSALLARDELLQLHDLPTELLQGVGDAGLTIEAPWFGDPSRMPSLREVRARALERVDRVYLDRLLSSTGGRVGDAARRAGVDARSLYGLMRRYGLRKEDFKPRPRARRPEGGGGPA